MTTKHTPGPWRVSEHDDGSILGHRTGSCSAIVARIEPWFSNKKQGEHATQDLLAANARLIAAAPELLEACKLAAAKFDRMFPRIANVCRAAIAKATEGEE